VHGRVAPVDPHGRPAVDDGEMWRTAGTAMDGTDADRSARSSPHHPPQRTDRDDEHRHRPHDVHRTSLVGLSVPEGVEVELYRRSAEVLVGQRIAVVRSPDAWFVDGVDMRALVGHRIAAARRIGKVLCLPTDGPTLGLRFGMTGRLIVGDDAAVGDLRYGPAGDDAAWDRFAFVTDRGVDVRVNDPRRLGGAFLDPDTSKIGPDLFTVDTTQLSDALGGVRSPIKAALLDQARVGGLGNMLVDEVCWQCHLDPATPARMLDAAAIDRLAATIRETARRQLERGGSHLGDLPREPGAPCERDGAPLTRRTIGGRTTFSCPVCQS
jgi:formamidopyrimidine-DNA glycosylase